MFIGNLHHSVRFSTQEWHVSLTFVWSTYDNNEGMQGIMCDILHLRSMVSNLTYKWGIQVNFSQIFTTFPSDYWTLFFIIPYFMGQGRESSSYMWLRLVDVHLDDFAILNWTWMMPTTVLICGGYIFLSSLDRCILSL